MNSIKLKAYAKINLILDLPSVLPNGYHSIFTVMQSVSLCDEITVTKSSQETNLTCSDLSVPADSRNTAIKAVKSFEKHTGLMCNVSIDINKNIPSGAGLGGGSSDAAAVVRALNMLYGTNISEEALRRICLEVGADVPFCLSGGTALCQNIGEVISPLPPFPDSHIIIVKPESSVSTRDGYAMFDSLHSVRRPRKEEFIYYAQKGDLYAMCERVSNVFEQAVDVSHRADIKSVFRKNSSLCACMSGSGSSVFGIFDSEEAAARCERDLKTKYRLVFRCKNVNSGSEIIPTAE